MISRIGVCSWSLQPLGPGDLARKVRACGIDWVQLALEPLRTGLWRVDETHHQLAAADVRVVSGMVAMEGEDYTTLESIRRTGGIRPDATWERNLFAARECAAIARDLGLSLVTFHAGYIPEHDGDPERTKILDRVRAIVDEFAACGVRVALETGQESPGGMMRALLDLRRAGAGVNFDPANLILYGTGDPVEGLDLLHEWVRQVHVKDAVPTRVPGEWGVEVPAGFGVVDWKTFFTILETRGVNCDLVVERESGDDRMADVRRAKSLIESFGAPRA